MKIHILGICGTFMGGVAALAREAGHIVEGSDQGVYPPMSTQLEELGIQLKSGYSPANISDDVDQIVVGNAMSRGNPAVEWMLDNDIPYESGPRWLSEHVLKDRKVIAVAGTHGKTTTSSLVAWLLDDAGLDPGFLIGGVPANFGVSARLGGGEYFVVEADEYDTAFFDKRSKFVHYHPDIAILNNLEFDHADIFDNLGQIKRQFHHLVRTIPGKGHIVVNQQSHALNDVIDMGCWSHLHYFGQPSLTNPCWNIETLDVSKDEYLICSPDGEKLEFTWQLSGEHNLQNAQGAIAAATLTGVPLKDALDSISRFTSVARRMQLLNNRDDILIYEDFAHHPTAIQMTLAAFKKRFPHRRLIAVLEPRSNSMRDGAHTQAIPSAIQQADVCYILAQNLKWEPDSMFAQQTVVIEHDAQSLLKRLYDDCVSGDLVVFMSNGSFSGIQHRFAQLGTP